MSPVLAKRLMVIGLDGLESSLAFDRFADVMPNLASLRERGVWGRWKSVVPPVSVPSWQCMATSRDPGALGLYGFRNRGGSGYDAVETADGRMVSGLRVWDVLSRNGFKNIVLGVPLTFPPKPLSGVMVSGYPFPGTESNYTYPASLKAEIEQVVDYIPDVTDFRTSAKERIVARVFQMTRRRFQLAEYLLRTRPWQFFMMVETGPERLAHALLSYVDPTHPRFDPEHPLAGMLRDYYALCDQLLGDLILPYVQEPNTGVMAVAAHGVQPLHGSVAVNEWLIEKGYLVLKERPPEPQTVCRMHQAKQIDWSRSAAWAEGGGYARIMLNVRGREAQGMVDLRRREDWRERLARELAEIVGPDGRTLATKVYFPESTYQAATELPPDLVVFFDDLRYRAAGLIGANPPESIVSPHDDQGCGDANSCWRGCFAAAGGGLPDVGEMEDLSLLDFGPTVLDHFSAPVPQEYQGTTIGARAGRMRAAA